MKFSRQVSPFNIFYVVRGCSAWLSLSCLHSRDYSSPLVTMERHLLKGRIYNGLFFSEADGLQTSINEIFKPVISS